MLAPSFETGWQAISYPDAPPSVQTYALQCLPQLFGTAFASLSWEQWHLVFSFCYPELIVTSSSVDIEDESYRRIITYLTLMHGEEDEWVAGSASNQSYHVARKLLYFASRAQSALSQAKEVAESEQADILALYESVLLDLTNGDALADEIVEAHSFCTSPQVPAAPPQPTQSKKVTISSASSARSVHDQPERWEHLQRWFEETNDPARPWNVSGISRQLKLTQSVTRALLTAPKGAAGMSRTAFSSYRLRQLQRYFTPYGYVPPPNNP